MGDLLSLLRFSAGSGHIWLDGQRMLLLHARAFPQLRDGGHLSFDADPHRAAGTTIAIMDGLQVQWLLDRDVVDMAEELSDFFASFVAGFHDQAAAAPAAGQS